MGISILSDGVGKPFSVRPTADDLICRNAWNRCIHSQWCGGKAIFSASCNWWWLNSSEVVSLKVSKLNRSVKNKKEDKMYFSPEVCRKRKIDSSLVNPSQQLINCATKQSIHHFYKKCFICLKMFFLCPYNGDKTDLRYKKNR